MQTITTIGLDIAKSVFQVHGVDNDGKVVIRRQLKRRYVLAFFEKLQPCLIGIEACASSHHWSRELQALGLRGRDRTFLPQNHDLYQPNYRNTPSDALGVFEPQLLRACVEEANNPQHVPPGELRKIERFDEYGNVKCIDWVGQNFL